MEGHRLGLPAAMAVAAGAAGAATLALRPRKGLIRPAAVNATAYFSATELDRARQYQRPRRLLALAELATGAAALGAVSLRPPPAIRAALRAAERRPAAGAALTGVGLSLSMTALAAPFGAVGEQRARSVGISTRNWASWSADLAKAGSIGAAFAGAGAAGFLALARRYPRTWWVPSAAALTSLSALMTFASPIVLDPLFNKFTPLPAGPLRAEILALAARSNIEIGEVYRIDASRRTNAVNAYVGGLGTTKRVVLFDTLLERFSADEIRSVVAHELAHVDHRDVIRGLAWIAAVAPSAALVVQRLVERIDPEGGSPRPALIPLSALVAGAVSSVAAIGANALSRRFEARADAYALRLTGDPKAFISVEQKLCTENFADPDPPRLLRALFGTHPRAVERIGYAVAFAPEGA